VGKWAESPQTRINTGFFRARFPFGKWAKDHKSGQNPFSIREVAYKKWAKPVFHSGSSRLGSKNGHKNSPSVASFRPQKQARRHPKQAISHPKYHNNLPNKARNND